MRLTTIRRGNSTHAARLEGDDLVLLDAPDVGSWLERHAASNVGPPETGEHLPVSEADFAPLVVQPSKVICVGLNYRSHILEMGRELPEFPTLFAKFARTLIGARDDLVLPSIAERPDWEAELGVVIGAPLRRASIDEAREALAGYTVVNDVSMRDWQYRTLQWMQGKAFESTTPVGPYLVTPDEIDGASDLELRCEVDGVIMQSARTSDLLFSPAELAAYISQIITLDPGDLVSTGTPGGVGEARTPRVHLHPDQVLTTSIDGIGSCVNRCIAEETGPLA